MIILLGYWMLCMFLGTPGDQYSLNGFFGTDIDKAILGIPHMYKGEGVPFDPEGLVSTLTLHSTGDLWIFCWKLHSAKR